MSIWNRVAVLFGLVVAAIGVLGVAAPTVLFETSSFLLTANGLYAAAAFRIVVGLVLVLAAATSRMPRTLRILGILIILGGIITPFVGVDRARAIVEWWATLRPWFMRAWAVLAVALGSLIIYAARSKSAA